MILRPRQTMSDEKTSVDDSIASATSAYEFPKSPATSLSDTRATLVHRPVWAARIPGFRSEVTANLPEGGRLLEG